MCDNFQDLFHMWRRRLCKPSRQAVSSSAGPLSKLHLPKRDSPTGKGKRTFFSPPRVISGQTSTLPIWGILHAVLFMKDTAKFIHTWPGASQVCPLFFRKEHYSIPYLTLNLKTVPHKGVPYKISCVYSVIIRSGGTTVMSPYSG